MTTETTASIDYPHIGSHQAWRSPLGTTITVVRTHFTFVVETRQGPSRDESRSQAFATESEARGYARLLAEMQLAADKAAEAMGATKAEATQNSSGTTPEAKEDGKVKIMQSPHFETLPRLVSTVPVAKGKQLAMSFAQASVIWEVAGFGGYIHRGQPSNWGRASTSTLTAMAKRGFGHIDVQMFGQRKVVMGLTVSVLGATKAAEILREHGYVEQAEDVESTLWESED